MTRKILVILTKLAINALALLVVDYLFDGIRLEDLQTMIVAAVVLALVNSFLRPFIIILTLPINVLSLGLLTLVINALMLMLVAWLVPTFHVDGVLDRHVCRDRDEPGQFSPELVPAAAWHSWPGRDQRPASSAR